MTSGRGGPFRADGGLSRDATAHAKFIRRDPHFSRLNAGFGRSGVGRVLAPMDVVTIKVLELPDIDTTTRVEEDGTINFPYIGRIKAAGRTQDKVAAEIEMKLIEKKILARP